MRKRSGSGALDKLVSFQTRALVDDGYGNEISGDWEEQFQEPARLVPKMGSETIIASRMTGVQPYTLTVRGSERTRCITTDWRVVNVRSGAAYNILTNVNVDERGAWQEMLVTEGAPT